MADDDVKIFVAWDSELKAAGRTFRELADDPPTGVRVEILGVLGDPAYGVLHERIVAGIQAAGGLLAIVDQPNANMSREVGLGLAHGLRVSLATEAAQLPQWMDNTPFAGVLKQHSIADEDIALELIGQHDEWIVVRRPRRAERKFVLCLKEGTGKSWGRKLRPLLGDGWTIVDAVPGTFPDLPALLEGVDRLAWVVLPAVSGQPGHSVANTVGALVAGFAEGCGLPCVILSAPESEKLADLAGRVHAFDGSSRDLAAQISAWSTSLDTPTRPAHDPLTAYLAAVVRAHDHPLRYVERLGLKATELVPIDLDVEAGGDIDCLEPRGRKDEARRGRLRALVNQDFASGKAPRWLLKAEPGAGKTTLLRQLAHDLAAECGDVPLFVALADWEAHPAESVEEAAARQAGVDRLPRTGGRRRWLILDGFDEVRKHDAMRKRILGLDGPDAVIVASRAGAIEEGRAWASFTAATVRYLNETEQAVLVHRLAPDEAESFGRSMRDRPGVAVLLRNPFLLTLAVGLHVGALDKGREPPRDRLALLTRALDDCLRHGWSARESHEELRERWDPRGARHVLRALALALHEAGAETWSRDKLADVLVTLPGIGRWLGPDGLVWKSPAVFLDDVQAYAGVLGPLDGQGMPWRFLHRSLREALAAECLADEMDKERRHKDLDRLLGPKDGPARSAEILALLAGRLLDPEGDGSPREVDPTEPVAHLRRLVTTAPDAAVRALASVERLDAWTHLELMLEVPPPKDQPWRQVGWDGAQLDAVIDAIARGRRAEPLWDAVTPERSTFHLGVLWYALERVETWEGEKRGWTTARRAEAAERFFAACGRGGRRPKVEMVAIPAGTFWMGSADGVGNDREYPRHEVRVGAFHLGRTVVTVAHYRAFDAGTTGDAQLPVVDVDWFSARLFAAWLGGRLPAEAEWEYACRAGTDTLWSFGDDERKLGDHAWFAGNSGRELHPVGQKRPNPWGLHDMHGNVWEWCDDVHAPYGADSAAVRADRRVFRGGSWDSVAVWCRSAHRLGIGPDVRDLNLGFRVVLAAPAPQPGS